MTCHCGKEAVANVVTPSHGAYDACYDCMTGGVRPPCGCGASSDLKDGRGYWCSLCYAATARELAKQNAARRAEALAAADKAFQDRIDAAVKAALEARGL
jgi:hypothetical protein